MILGRQCLDMRRVDPQFTESDPDPKRFRVAAEISLRGRTVAHAIPHQMLPLLVEPDILEARAVVYAVDHADQTLDV